jgi:hypothetical protein
LKFNVKDELLNVATTGSKSPQGKALFEVRQVFISIFSTALGGRPISNLAAFFFLPFARALFTKAILRTTAPRRMLQLQESYKTLYKPCIVLRNTLRYTKGFFVYSLNACSYLLAETLIETKIISAVDHALLRILKLRSVSSQRQPWMD